MESFFVSIAAILGIGSGIYLGHYVDKINVPTHEEIVCIKKCDPNFGMIRKTKCYCENRWSQPNGK